MLVTVLPHTPGECNSENKCKSARKLGKVKSPLDTAKRQTELHYVAIPSVPPWIWGSNILLKDTSHPSVNPSLAFSKLWRLALPIFHWHQASELPVPQEVAGRSLSSQKEVYFSFTTLFIISFLEREVQMSLTTLSLEEMHSTLLIPSPGPPDSSTTGLRAQICTLTVINPTATCYRH